MTDLFGTCKNNLYMSYQENVYMFYQENVYMFYQEYLYMFYCTCSVKKMDNGKRTNKNYDCILKFKIKIFLTCWLRKTSHDTA